MIKEIRVFQTHIEVHPYKKGEWLDLEHFYSTYQRRGSRGFYKPFCYTVERGTLYLPKGTNITTLENGFGVEATYEKFKHSRVQKMSEVYGMRNHPRSNDQSQAIDFISGKGIYSGNKKLAQVVVQSAMSFGKTYVSIASMISIGVKAAVVVYSDTIFQQWSREVLVHTTMPASKIIMVKGVAMMDAILSGEVEGDIYIFMHQTISTGVRLRGRDFVQKVFEAAGIGIKFVDESHKYLAAIVRLDSIVNIERNVYLSGTFTRSRYKEAQIMKAVFSNAAFFGDTVNKTDLKDRKMIYIVCKYKSLLEGRHIMGMTGNYGFSPHKFIDFALKYDPGHRLMSTIKYLLDRMLIEKPELYPGKILIVVALKEAVLYLAETISRMYGRYRTVGMITSDVKGEEERKLNFSREIICSTIESCGEGYDEVMLQTIICAEPHGSVLITKQLKGRLDRYKGEGSTFFYDLIDTNIPYLLEMEKKHRKVMTPFVRTIEEIRL